MTTKTLDITGKVCPYTALAVQKAVKDLLIGDELVITCDHPPAATISIPQFASENRMAFASQKIESGLWVITLTKK